MTPAAAIAATERAIAAVGETVTLRRPAGVSPQTFTDAEARARVTDFHADELVGSLQQGDRKLIVLAKDLEARQWPVPPRKGDKAIVRGKTLNVEAVDDSTRRVGGVIVAYEIAARG